MHEEEEESLQVSLKETYTVETVESTWRLGRGYVTEETLGNKTVQQKEWVSLEMIKKIEERKE